MYEYINPNQVNTPESLKKWAKEKNITDFQLTSEGRHDMMITQSGPTCGISALAYILPEEIIPPRIHSPHSRYKDTKKTGGFLYASSLRYIAKHEVDKKSDRGEIIDPQTFVEMGQRLGVDVDVSTPKSEDYINKLLEGLAQGYNQVVSFDLGEKGVPMKFNGNKAHWGVIIGHYTTNNKVFL